MNKIEYIKQLKKLIKKYHPDLRDNDLFESMYNEITKILVNKLNEVKNSSDINEHKLYKREEPDYFYYKLGVKYYKNIHPNKFYKRNEDLTFETRPYNEFVSILNKIYLSFNLSEYYFRKIINEYKNSVYYEDSMEKIKLLKRLYTSYKNIILEENKVINNDIFMKEMGLKML
ncbi:MAG: hypothetical protein FWC21_02020 [Treponema sp.]|nr:hypothetical protein [Treponema sp.]